MLIKPMESETEIQGKAYMHWKSWQEAYADLLPQEFLENVYTLERCQDWAVRYPQNVLVALVDERVVGFTCYGASSQEDLQPAGEIYALYVLSDYYGQKIGYQLMQAALENCRATNRFPSGSWRGMRVRLPSMKKLVFDLMVSKKLSI